MSPAGLDAALIATVADELPVGVWVARAPQGEFVYANRAFREIMGMEARPDVAAGGYATPYGIHQHNGEPYPEDRLPFVRALRSREVVVVDDIVIHRADGRKVFIRAFARPVCDAADTVTHIVIAFIEITLEVEAERGRLAGEARLRAAQRMESIGVLSGGIAHDFNNLLAAIKLLAGTARVRETDPARVEIFETIDQVVDTGVRLTRSLLKFSRRGEAVVHLTSLNAVVGNIASLCERTLDRRITLRVERCEGDTPVLADVSQLEQVVLNLLVNARDAIDGNGEIVLRTFEWTDASRSSSSDRLGPGPYVVLEVQDTGRGVDPETSERIFEPYFTTKPGGADKGTGLGLSTVFGIVASHAGAVEVARTSREGTTMRVVLPRAPIAEATESPRAARGTELSRGSGVVLVVDDEDVLRDGCALALRNLGYEVLTARDGHEALEIFRERHRQLSAVLLDVVMPRMTGDRARDAMRAIDADVPVVLTSAMPPNVPTDGVASEGTTPFLAKPYSIEEVARVLTGVSRRLP